MTKYDDTGAESPDGAFHSPGEAAAAEWGRLEQRRERDEWVDRRHDSERADSYPPTYKEPTPRSTNTLSSRDALRVGIFIIAIYFTRERLAALLTSALGRQVTTSAIIAGAIAIAMVVSVLGPRLFKLLLLAAAAIGLLYALGILRP